MDPKFFDTQAEFRKWLAGNHASETELWVGFYKKASGKTALTYREALDEALCFGWIDGLTRSLGEEARAQRWTPRRKRRRLRCKRRRRRSIRARSASAAAAWIVE